MYSLATIADLYATRTDSVDPYDWSTKDETAANSLHRKIIVTLWETLISVDVKITRTAVLKTLMKSIWRKFPESTTSLTLFYLPREALWETDRIEITTGEQLIDLVFNHAVQQFYAHYSNVVMTPATSFTSMGASIIGGLRGSVMWARKVVPYNDGLYDEEQQRLEKHVQLTARSAKSAKSSSASRSPQEEAFEEKVLIRDCDTCVFCSSSEVLKAAKVLRLPIASSKIQAQYVQSFGLTCEFDVHNGITLCDACFELFASDQVGVKPEDSTLVACHNLLLDTNNSANAQWKILNGQAIRFPYDPAMSAMWPPAAIFRQRYVGFQQKNSGPGVLSLISTLCIRGFSSCLSLIMRWYQPVLTRERLRSRQLDANNNNTVEEFDLSDHSAPRQIPPDPFAD